jgi:hypothetical protein
MLLAAVLLTALGLVVISGASSPAHASGCHGYIVTANSSNTTSNWTNLTTTDPNAIVFVTPGWAGTYSNHPIGVWYTGSRWAVYNQDLTPMPLGATFQVTWASPYMSPTEDVYVHTATAANIVGDYTILNDPLANGNPNAVVQVTANYNPPGLGGVYNNHPIGVWYTGSRWAIFNQDAAGMPVGAHFNVMVLPSSESHPNVGWYVHTSSSSNISGNLSTIPSPTTNANTYLVVTPNYNPGGGGGTFHNHNIGVYYNGSHWGIFNQDVAAMAPGHSFNVYWQTC